MSAPFRRWAVHGWADEPVVDLAYQTVGRRLDLPLRMAASIDRTLAQFSTGDEAILSQAEADAAVPLSGGRSTCPRARRRRTWWPTRSTGWSGRCRRSRRRARG